MTNKYKIRCTNDAFYPEIWFRLKRAGISFTQKEERPVVCRVEKDETIRKAFSECLLQEEDYSILKKVGDSWVTIPHEVQEVQENNFLDGLSDIIKRIYNDLQNGKKISCSDLDYLIYKFEVDREGNTFIIELGGKYYSISLKEGSNYWTQPVEVEKHEYEKVVTLTEWKPVGKEREAEKVDIDR